MPWTTGWSRTDLEKVRQVSYLAYGKTARAKDALTRIRPEDRLIVLRKALEGDYGRAVSTLLAAHENFKRAEKALRNSQVLELNERVQSGLLSSSHHPPTTQEDKGKGKAKRVPSNERNDDSRGKKPRMFI